ncbi:MAG: hypothetical protein EA408_05925 [Marinilabiliales bacterium]|nr:MAG: hypothetical protein EA408_05925 [Marinilabiliales bacterium]
MAGCEKEPADEIYYEYSFEHSLIIINKQDTLLQLIYTDSLIISYKTMENNIIEETEFHYDSSGLLTGLTIYNLTNNRLTHKDFSYDSLNRISSIYVSRPPIRILETRTLIYNEAGKLIQIKAFFPEAFEYAGNNVSKNGRVDIDIGVWTEFVYSYDSMINPVYNIGLPLISAKQLSQNNRKSKIALWDEYPDCMLEDDPHCNIINHVDTIYTSTFVYNRENKPKTEFRKYKNRVDTLVYLYKTTARKIE